MHIQRQDNPADAQAATVGGHARELAVLCIRQPQTAEIRRLVQALQARLEDCDSGVAALAVARARPLSCVIAPLALPDMTASEFIERLHAIALGMPVIVIVDDPEVSEAVAVMRSGAHAVVDGRTLGRGLLPHLAFLLRGP